MMASFTTDKPENRFDLMESKLHSVKKDIDNLSSKIQNAYPDNDNKVSKSREWAIERTLSPELMSSSVSPASNSSQQAERNDCSIDSGLGSIDAFRENPLQDKLNYPSFNEYALTNRLFSSYSENDIHPEDDMDELAADDTEEDKYLFTDNNHFLRSWRSPDDYHHHHPLDNHVSLRNSDFDYDSSSPRSLSPNSLEDNEYYLEESDDVITFPICPSNSVLGYSSHYRRILSTHYEEAEEYTASNSSDDNSVLEIESTPENLSIDIDNTKLSMESLNDDDFISNPQNNRMDYQEINSMHASKHSSLISESDTDTYVTVRSRIHTEYNSDSTSITESFKTCHEFGSSEEGSVYKDFAVMDKNQNNHADTSDDDISTVDSKDGSDTEEEVEDKNELPKLICKPVSDINKSLSADHSYTNEDETLGSEQDLEWIPQVNMKELVAAWRKASVAEESTGEKFGGNLNLFSEANQGEMDESNSGSWYTIDETSSGNERPASSSSSQVFVSWDCSASESQDHPHSPDHIHSENTTATSVGKKSLNYGGDDSKRISDNLAEELMADSPSHCLLDSDSLDTGMYQFIHKMWSSRSTVPLPGVRKLSGTKTDCIDATTLKDQTHPPERQTIDLSTKNSNFIKQRKHENEIIDNSLSEQHPTSSAAANHAASKEGNLTHGNFEKYNSLIVPANNSLVNKFSEDQTVTDLTEQQQHISFNTSSKELTEKERLEMEAPQMHSCLDSPDLESGFSMSECNTTEKHNPQSACFGKSLVPKNSQAMDNIEMPPNSVRAVASSHIHIRRANQIETTSSVQAEAVGSNLSIAAARATAKAVGIASANASNTDDDGDDAEFQFVITTSCKITPPVRKPAVLPPPMASPDDTSMASSNESGQTIKPARYMNNFSSQPPQPSISNNGPTLNQFIKRKFPELEPNSRTMSGNSSISSVMSLDVDAVMSDLKKSAVVSRSLSSKLYTPNTNDNMSHLHSNTNNSTSYANETIYELNANDSKDTTDDTRKYEKHQSLSQSMTLPSHRSRVKQLKSLNSAEKVRQKFKATDIDRASSMRHLDQYNMSPLSLNNLSMEQGGASQYISFHDVAHSNNLKRAKSNPNNLFTSEYIIQETDIDTGRQAERSLLMETDIDGTKQDDIQQAKSHSMCNLLAERPPDLVSDILEEKRFNRAQSIATLTQTKRKVKNENDLATRLANKAKSLTELRIAESVKKLNVPDWLNEAPSDDKVFDSTDGLVSQVIDISSPTSKHSPHRYASKSNTFCTRINPRYTSKLSATAASTTQAAKPFELPSKRMRTKSEETLSRIKPINSKLREIAQRSNLSNEKDIKTPIKSILKKSEDKTPDFHLDPKDFIIKGESTSTSKSSKRLVEEKLILTKVQLENTSSPVRKEIILSTSVSDPSAESGFSSGGQSDEPLDFLDAEKEREVRDFMSAPPSTSLNLKKLPNSANIEGDNMTTPTAPKRMSSLSKTFTETNSLNLVTKQGDHIVDEQHLMSTKTSTVDMPAVQSSTERENFRRIFHEKRNQLEMLGDSINCRNLMHSFFIDSAKPIAKNDSRNLSTFQNDELLSLLTCNLRFNVKDFYYDVNYPVPFLNQYGEIISQCSYTACSREHIINPQTYVSCENCYLYYCSKQCRSIHKFEHQSLCTFGRPRYVANKVLKKLAPSQIKNLSEFSVACYKLFGRGCSLLLFQTHAFASSFILKETNALAGSPLYLTETDVDRIDLKLKTPCENYNPDTSMVLVIAVGANTYFGDSDECKYFKQCIVLPLESTSSTNEEIITTKLKAVDENMECASLNLENKRDSRELYYQLIIRYFRDRGVILRSTFPDFFQKLTLFVELGIEFAPQSVTFLDFTCGDLITCIVSPMQEPEIKSAGSPNNFNQSSETLITDL